MTKPSRNTLIENVSKAYFELTNIDLFASSFSLADLDIATSALFDSLPKADRDVIVAYANLMLDEESNAVKALDDFAKASMYVFESMVVLSHSGKFSALHSAMESMLPRILKLNKFADNYIGCKRDARGEIESVRFEH